MVFMTGIMEALYMVLAKGQIHHQLYLFYSSIVYHSFVAVCGSARADADAEGRRTLHLLRTQPGRHVQGCLSAALVGRAAE